MNFYQNLKTVKSLQKAAKCLVIFGALILVGAVIFYTTKDLSSTTTNVDCASLANTVTAQPGNNCLFSSMSQDGAKVLPLCQTISGTNYTIDSSNILSTGIRRYTCNDLSDLALCSGASTDLPGKNCASLCDSSFVGDGTRGVDYAIHNRDCIRFCDAPEEGVTANSGVNCTDRKCHQLSSGTVPIPSPATGTNCVLTPCNLLSIKELIDVAQKIGSDSTAGRTVGRYCDGDFDVNSKPLKCYNFSKEQLPYVVRSEMCTIHNCPPPESCSTTYVSSSDVNNDGVIDSYDNNDTLNISDRDKNGTTDSDTSYVDAYIAGINGGDALTSSSYCSAIFCKAIVKKQYRCVDNSGNVSGDNALDINRNSSCDSSGEGAACNGNLCYKTIDCNIATNSGEAECAISTDGQAYIDDDTNSWLYRPKPHSEAVEDANGLKIMRNFKADELCYSKDNMAANGWGDDTKKTVDFGAFSITFDLGFFHSYLLPDRTRSPGICDASNDGSRGNGYVYLCYGDGNSKAGQLYAQVSDQTAYVSGYTRTVFKEGDAEHTVKVCLRFRNAMRPDDGTSETCGKRNCGISCAFDNCSSQVCGYDVCKDLTISDLDPRECEMGDSLFNNDQNSRDCMAKIDEYLRLRIQKYGNRICSFLDVRGQTAYPNSDGGMVRFADGTEKIVSIDECIIGSKNSSGNCDGKSSYDSKESAEKWRTIKFGTEAHIPYIQSNQPSDKSQGFFDKNFQFHKEQDCMFAPLRLPPPPLYNLATVNNAAKLFTPPIYITNALTHAGGPISPRPLDSAYGPTDFHNPAIQVNFGNTTQEFSLDFDQTGYEETAEFTTLTTTVNLIPYSVDVFVRKEFNQTSKTPTFCLYRRVIDINGVENDPARIQCVERNYPTLDNTAARLLSQIYSPNNPLPANRVLISLDSSSTYSSSKINLRYLGGFGSDNIDNNCASGSDDLCSSIISLDNVDSTQPTCTTAIVDPTNPATITPAMYNICAQRDECSQLNVECIKNEVDMQAARVGGQSIDSFMVVRNYCNNHLLPMCNARKGITATGGTITDTNPTGAAESATAYGWFNEICIVGSNTANSFDNQLKLVVAHATVNGVKGKCIIDASQSTSSDCSAGGKAPQCVCQTYDPESTAIAVGQEVRLQTHREAGLCVDMPLPQTCGAIDYNPVSTIASDPDYTYTSLAATTANPSLDSYGANYDAISNVVHLSHRYRSLGNGVTGSLLDGSGHAEFPVAVLGAINIEGTCNGFWKKSLGSNGISVSPTRTCLNENGTARWDTNVTNSCIRYSCEARETTGALTEVVGSNYQGGYASNEIDDFKGTSDGFATWPLTTKTTDFLEKINATACIPGFKKVGSTADKVNNKIVSYSGGTTPTRVCNQIGTWQTPENSCTRIKCPEVNPAIPADANATEAWQAWYDSGGATFPETNASRSTETGILATGTCKNSLGFFNLGEAPTRRCDYLGNWGEVINPCTTRCDAIDAAKAPGSNNGNALWSEANISIGTETAGVFGGCLSGYVPYPYPALKNDYGVPFNLAMGSITTYDYTGKTVTPISGTANYSTSIPLDVTVDTRTAGNPVKYCQALSYDGVITNTWAAANSSCISGCPGYLEDGRVGVGTTQHNTRNGKITVRWPNNASFGRWYYYLSSDPTENAHVDTPSYGGYGGSKANDYAQNRTNGYYLLARYCGDGSGGTVKGKWSDPIPQCATNGGQINQGSNYSYALYYTSSPHGSTASNSLDIGGVASTTTCLSSIYRPSGSESTPLPISNYTCSYKDSNQNIDETYFNYNSGSPCQVYCSAPVSGTVMKSDAITLGNSYYSSGATTYTKQGDSVALVCNSGYAKKPDNDASTSDDSCGIASTARGSTPPTIVCGADGSFGNIVNDCTACNSCTSESPLIPNIVDVGDGDVGDDPNDGLSHSFVAAGSTTVRGYSTGGENCGNKNEDYHIHDHLMVGCPSPTTLFATSSGACVSMRFTDEWECKNDTRHTNIDSFTNIECMDGNWVPSNCSADRIMCRDDD